MAKKKPTKKRDRYATKTRKELDVRAAIVRKVRREILALRPASSDADAGWNSALRTMIEWINDMDTRANAKRGGGMR